MMPRVWLGRQGGLLGALLLTLGLVHIILGAYFALVHQQIQASVRASARVQAWYLAETGLEAGIDALAQRWDSASDSRVFPMRETIRIPGLLREVTIGDFTVTAQALPNGHVRVVATGRSVPEEHGAGTAMANRRLIAHVARRWHPRFRRVGDGAMLQLDTHHLDEDGIPDTLVLSGLVSWAETTSEWLGNGPGLLGYRLVASFSDVDLDGDLDLIVARVAEDEFRGGLIPTQPAFESADGDGLLPPREYTMADVFGTGDETLVLATGWLWIPDGMLSQLSTDTNVFVNTLSQDGFFLTSWAELPPAALPSRSSS